MKYIVTEEQFKTAEQSVRAYRLERTILEYLHNHLTPFEGWNSYEEYQIELEETGGELFIYVVDYNSPDTSGNSDDFMWYSLCDNENLSEPLPEGHCPVVVLPTLKYDALDGYFGNNWQILFKRWFLGHTGLNVVQIDRN
jgi:hypothetical protein